MVCNAAAAAGVAQLVERAPRKGGVGGSSPLSGSTTRCTSLSHHISNIAFFGKCGCGKNMELQPDTVEDLLEPTEQVVRLHREH